MDWWVWNSSCLGENKEKCLLRVAFAGPAALLATAFYARRREGVARSRHRSARTTWIAGRESRLVISRGVNYARRAPGDLSRGGATLRLVPARRYDGSPCATAVEIRFQPTNRTGPVRGFLFSNFFLPLSICPQRCRINSNRVTCSRRN